MSDDKVKYQVFISSTYEDLRGIRKEAMWELMKENHIAAGMEDLTAQNDRGWESIRLTIDESDYFVLIMAGKYGSVEQESGKSWTQLEFEYARSKGIPILAFIREDSQNTSERDERLEKFKADVRKDRYCPSWKDIDELTREIPKALRRQITEDTRAGKGRTGWRRRPLRRVTPVKTICPMKNWVIASQKSDFTNALRNALENRRGQLGIEYLPLFKQDKEHHGREYRELLGQFIEDATNGSWLFTNYPEDDRNGHSEREEDRLIEKLIKQDKRMICFESGHNLRTRGDRYPGGVNPIGVIETDAGHAIPTLIGRMSDRVWRKDDIRQVEIVYLMGPRAANTQERASKYLEIFRNFDPDGKVLGATVFKALPSWLENDCKPEISKFLEFRHAANRNGTGPIPFVENESGHVTFVCGNDDLAVIVHDAVSARFPDDLKKGRVSFVGFDGMPCMEELKKKLESKHLAATARVDFHGMVRIAIDWLSTRSVPSEPETVEVLEVG